MEPYKVAEGEHVRGIPTLHEDLSKYQTYFDLLDCTVHVEDPQCKHDHFRDNYMIRSGHHVRMKNVHPVIGILTQPLPDERFETSVLTEEFNRINKEIKDEKSKEQGFESFEDPFPAK